MTVPEEARPPSGDSEDDAGEAENPFAGLTGLDIVDGELMPRRRRRRAS